MNKGNRGSFFNNRNNYANWILLAFFFVSLIYVFWSNDPSREIQQLKYSDFVSMVAEGKVATAQIMDQYVEGTLADGKRYVSTIVRSESLWNDLIKNHVEVHVVPQGQQNWFASFFNFAILLLLGFLLYFYVRQAGQGGGGGAGRIFSVGKSKARFFLPNTIQVTFKDVAGAGEAKEELKDVVDFLKNPSKFDRLGAKIPRGVLLSGAPGNGKTLLAKAVAGEASCPFFSISGSDFVEVFVGVGASRVRDLFVQARKHAPSIVFIDEIDAVGRARGAGMGGGNDEREQTLNQLLAEMDGFSTEAGSVIVIAATNRPDVLDKALLRPGRFDRTIEVPYPDMRSRKEILAVHIKKITLSPEVDLELLARGTPGFSGAELENLINEAALSASKADKAAVEIVDFERARDKLMMGAERKTLIFTEEEKRQTAYHESGHSLLNLLLPETDPFHKVTIIPRGRALGVSWSLPEGDSHSHSKDYMVARIMVALGGHLAEKLVFNSTTTGAASDFENATKIARSMVCYYGMSDLGTIFFSTSNDGFQQTKSYSEDTARKIDEEVSKIMKSCYEKAEQMLISKRQDLDKLAAALLEKETLLAQEVYELLGYQPRETHSFKAEQS